MWTKGLSVSIQARTHDHRILRLACIRWPNGEKLAQSSVRISESDPKGHQSAEVNASHASIGQSSHNVKVGYLIISPIYHDHEIAENTGLRLDRLQQTFVWPGFHMNAAKTQSQRALAIIWKPSLISEHKLPTCVDLFGYSY